MEHGRKGVQLWSVGVIFYGARTEGREDSFESFIHIVEQQLTVLQYFFVKQTTLCLEFGKCVLVKCC